jgi:hypothetical protein
MGLESVRGPQSSSETLALDTLDRFQARYPAHCGLPTADCTRLIVVHVPANYLPIFYRDLHR